MRLLLIFYGLLAYIIPLISATALTYKLTPNEKACFFTFVQEKGAKLAFYFAASPSQTFPSSNDQVRRVLTCRAFGHLQVQSGGSFDVDYNVVGPGDKVIMDAQKERQGDFVFTAKEAGEYRFCFDNDMSTFAEKVVDFEIAV